MSQERSKSRIEGFAEKMRKIAEDRVARGLPADFSEAEKAADRLEKQRAALLAAPPKASGSAGLKRPPERLTPGGSSSSGSR